MARIVKNPEERRGELIACAQQLFFSKGYESTSVNEIIEAAGVSKGTFYYYFESKQAILEAMVEVVIEQVLRVMQAIVDDETIDAITKWTRAFQVSGAWKLARREEMVAYIKILVQDDNVRLMHKIQVASSRAVPTQLAKIIEQGIAEGVFHTEYSQESAEICYAVLQTYSDAFGHILLHPEWYDSPVDTVRRKLVAIETAIERILGAPPGSIQLLEPQALTSWFGKESR